MCRGTIRTKLVAKKKSEVGRESLVNVSLPPYVGPLSLRVKSIPVWRMPAPEHPSPSIPTQAEAALQTLPEGTGTVKVPVTEVKAPCRDKTG